MQVPLWQTVKEEKVTESLYLCPFCSLLYSQANCLAVHLKKAHQVESPQVDSYGIPLEGSVMKLKRVWKGDPDHVRTCYKCLKCDAIIHHHRKFAQHIRVGADQQVTCEALCPQGKGLRSYQRTLFLKGYKNYLCHTCGASFTEKDTFYHHIEAHGETVAKKYVCEFCPYSATRQLRMVNHVMSKHSSEPRPRPHVCELCGKGFFNKNMLGQHKMDVHIKEKKYKCHLCPKVFLRRHKLTVHVKLHSGVRPFTCATCGQSFTAAYNLKVHQRLHTGEKPYKCAHCDAAFAQKSSLDVHMKKHGLGPTRQTKMYQTTSQPKVSEVTYLPPRRTTKSPKVKPPPPSLLPQPPPPQLSQVPPLVNSAQFHKTSSPSLLPQPPPSQLSQVPPLVDSAQFHKTSSPSLLPQPPPPQLSQVPPLVDSAQFHKTSSPPRPPQPEPSPPPPPVQRMDFPMPEVPDPPQQLVDFPHPNARMETDSPQPPRMGSDAGQHHRMESYMYPGYSGVVFPGLPGSSYPFYPNL